MKSKTVQRRVYLDHAATTWPKSEAVLEAVDDYMRNCGATSGRGAYSSALQADRWLEKARSQLAGLLHARSAEDIAFCTSGTHALNAAFRGLLKPGEQVITTAMEHNSVLRPLKQMETSLGISVDIVEADASGRSSAIQAASLVTQGTALLAVGHASNVTGAVNDLAPWRDLARQCDAKLLVDGSQTLGYLPIDVQASGIDVFAAAGHKGLRGLAGTGLLYVEEKWQGAFQPLMVGGTGRFSESIDDCPDWPYAVEVGNLNMPGVVSLAVAAEQLSRLDDLRASWLDCFCRLVTGLQRMPQVRLVGLQEDLADVDWSARVPVVSLIVDGWDVHDLAAILDTEFGIEARAGWHCAALIHAPVKSSETAGTLRFSTGHTTSPEDVDYVLAAMREVLG